MWALGAFPAGRARLPGLPFQPLVGLGETFQANVSGNKSGNLLWSQVAFYPGFGCRDMIIKVCLIVGTCSGDGDIGHLGIPKHIVTIVPEEIVSVVPEDIHQIQIDKRWWNHH